MSGIHPVLQGFILGIPLVCANTYGIAIWAESTNYISRSLLNLKFQEKYRSLLQFIWFASSNLKLVFYPDIISLFLLMDWRTLPSTFPILTFCRSSPKVQKTEDFFEVLRRYTLFPWLLCNSRSKFRLYYNDNQRSKKLII